MNTPNPFVSTPAEVDVFVNLVAAGEIGGILDIILNRLAAYIEKAAKLKRRMTRANKERLQEAMSDISSHFMATSLQSMC